VAETRAKSFPLCGIHVGRAGCTTTARGLRARTAGFGRSATSSLLSLRSRLGGATGIDRWTSHDAGMARISLRAALPVDGGALLGRAAGLLAESQQGATDATKSRQSSGVSVASDALVVSAGLAVFNSAAFGGRARGGGRRYFLYPVSRIHQGAWHTSWTADTPSYDSTRMTGFLPVSQARRARRSRQESSQQGAVVPSQQSGSALSLALLDGGVGPQQSSAEAEQQVSSPAVLAAASATCTGFSAWESQQPLWQPSGAGFSLREGDVLARQHSSLPFPPVSAAAPSWQLSLSFPESVTGVGWLVRVGSCGGAGGPQQPDPHAMFSG